MSIDHVHWMSSLLFLSITLITEGYTIGLYTPQIISAGPTYSSYKFNVLQHLSAISPYFESNSDGLSPEPPQGCTVDTAVYLVRHGSIYVNDYDYEYIIQPFLQHLKNSSNHVDFSNSADLAFLAHWTSPISSSDEVIEKLTKFGGLEAFNLGTQLAYRYPDLLPVKNDTSFKVWTSDSDRTRQSALTLFAGLYGGQKTIGQVVSISEEKDRGANTLTPTKTCPRFNASIGSKQADAWLRYYTVPIIARLSAKVSGFQFSATDVLAMQEMCGYETVIRGSSRFCGIFTPEEWLSFEYFFDIKYYYELGYGSDLSPSLGMPWVVASSDLLNHTTTTNQHLYISVAHRKMPPLILTALGLYNDSEYIGAANIDPTFPLDHINYQRAWRSSNFMSFLGRIALERLNCTSVAHTGSFVRVLVNSAPKPLPGCTSGPGASCSLGQYMDYIKRRNELFEDFSKACEAHNENPIDVLNFFLKEETV